MKTIINNLNISSIASWLPEEIIVMSDFKKTYGEETVNTIIKTTGIESARIAPSEMTSADMCFNAASYLIEKENIEINEIDGLVFVSQTPDYILPATSIILQDRLNLKKECVCIDVHYGCSGYIYGLLQASCWINSGLCKKVFVLAGDTTSRMINPNDRSLRMVFGDCGTATLVEKGDHTFGFDIMSDGSGFDKLIVPAGGFRHPSDSATNTLEYDEDGNGRTKNDLFMDGMAIFNFALSKVHKNINETIQLMDWKKEDVNMYLLHQANDFMVGYIRKKLKVEPLQVPTNAYNRGNTGPATIPLLCCDALHDYQGNLTKVIMSGFGVGLSWGSVALSLESTKFYKPVNS